jgi:hypothetical protein
MGVALLGRTGIYWCRHWNQGITALENILVSEGYQSFEIILIPLV